MNEQVEAVRGIIGGDVGKARKSEEKSGEI